MTTKQMLSYIQKCDSVSDLTHIANAAVARLSTIINDQNRLFIEMGKEVKEMKKAADILRKRVDLDDEDID
jgi:hypothetical protein